MTKGLIRLGVITIFLLATRIQANALQADSASVKETAAAQMEVFQMPAMLHKELTGKNTPTGLTTADYLSKRMCRGEFEALSLFIQPTTKVDNVKFTWTDFTSEQGYKISKDHLDVSIAKVWYQAGVLSSETTKKRLTQEVLVKNDNLIKVDYNTQTNYLLVSRNGSSFYQNISSPSTAFPTDVTVMDSARIQPFNLDGTTNRQIWLTVHVPEDAQPGKYTCQLTISSDLGVIKTIPVQIEVLPFTLDKSRLTYGIYYHGYADPVTKVPFSYTTKTPEQYRLEMQDMKDHGVLYPTTYQVLRNIDLDLRIRQEVGLPNDKLYSITLGTGNPTSSTELNNLKSQVQQWKTKIAQYGYKELYAYGIDEAHGTAFTQQRAAWNAVRQAGAKVFVAGYTFYLDQMGDILDVAVIQGPLLTSQSSGYHAKGNKIFSYSNPQVGQENPEVYRRNFGLALWKAGYDGAMNYAYQKFYKSGWNDFDNTEYREETFTYQTSNGLLKTIEWEGFREGVDDTRYLATLLNRIDALKAKGKDVTALVSFVNSIDPTQDLDGIRSQIIDKILSIESTGGTTDTQDTKTSAVVNDFALEQNYPNPFNPSTTIKFSLPQVSNVSLKIYDMLGKEVATLVNGEMTMGSHEVSFDANNLATGMYIYELRAGNFVQNRKMLLMK